jgi:uncharacterized protein (TIGR02271 family)
MQPRDPTDELPATAREQPAELEDTLELREEELHVRREMREVGQATIRTRVEEVPARLEVEAATEDVEVEHVPIGTAVSQRRAPYQDGDVLVIPVYEEQLVVTKRLVLREELRVRRTRSLRRELFEDTLRRERLDIDDPDHTGLVHEQYATTNEHGTTAAETPAGSAHHDTVAESGDHTDETEHEGLLSHLVRRALQ